MSQLEKSVANKQDELLIQTMGMYSISKFESNCIK